MGDERAAGLLGTASWLCACWPVPAVEAFWLRDVSWNRANSPGTNPPGVEALVAVEEDGVRGDGVAWVGSEGLFKGLVADWPFFSAVGNHRRQTPSIGLLVLDAF